MDATEIIKIIKACRKAKVEALKIGELELSFSTGDAEELKRPKGDTAKPPTNDELERSRVEAMNAFDEDAIDDELATLQIDDPQAYEQLLIQRELEFAPGNEETA